MSQFSRSNIWVLGIKLGLSGLVSSTFTLQDEDHQAHSDSTFQVQGSSYSWLLLPGHFRVSWAMLGKQGLIMSLISQKRQ